VVESLNNHKNINAVRFIGQASKNGDKGLRQKEQVKLIQQFKDGIYNVLVATSVAEEGLDIPSTDLVVFYEPIPSEIRTIQRRGRTGRRRAGKVIILIARNTRDEAYHWTSRSKEKRMKNELQILREELRKKLKVVGEPIYDQIKIDREEGFSTQEPEFKFNEIITTSNHEPDETELDLINATSEAESHSFIGQNSTPEDMIPEEADVKLEVLPSKETRSSNAQQGNAAAGLTSDELSEEQSIPLQAPTLLNKEDVLLDINQSSLSDFVLDNKQNIRIITDTREFNSTVARELSRIENVTVEPLQLGAGDYILSERVAIERKKTSDLLKSMIDGRLFSQLKTLRALYLNPILIIEGENLFTSKNINPNAVSGALASIVSDFRIPIINTKNELETAKILVAIARREQQEQNRSTNQVRKDKSILSFREQQQFIVEGLPNISSVIAQRLLAHFGSVKDIFNASTEELCQVKGIGKKTAEEIRKVIDEKYQ
jgi:Fanconi anemia group M protein